MAVGSFVDPVIPPYEPAVEVTVPTDSARVMLPFSPVMPPILLGPVTLPENRVSLRKMPDPSAAP